MERITPPPDPAQSSLCAKDPANPTLKGKGYKQLISAHRRSRQLLRMVTNKISEFALEVQGLTTDGSITVYIEKHVRTGE